MCFREDVKQAPHIQLHNTLASSHLLYRACITILRRKEGEKKNNHESNNSQSSNSGPIERLPCVLIWDVYVVVALKIIPSGK